MLQTLGKVTDEVLRTLKEEQRLRKTKELFLLFTLGSQFDHLIKLQLDRLGVFTAVANPSAMIMEDVLRLKPTGIILSGGPASAVSEPPPFDRNIFDIGIPTLGICLGFQLWAKHRGATVRAGQHREFGVHTLTIQNAVELFADLPAQQDVLESHGDRIEPGVQLETLGWTEYAPVAAGRIDHLYGVQFHPEVTETEFGPRILENFCFRICGARDRFPATAEAERKVHELRDQIGQRKVLLALSGGSDSSITAYLLLRALEGRPGQLRCVYIRGVDRPDDERHVHKYFEQFELNKSLELVIADATSAFLTELSGKHTMPEKREAVRRVYREILEQQAIAFGAKFIAQGTLYTDISESGGGYDSGARKARIKQHHNTNLELSLPELTPLADSVKDTARNIGRAIGVPEPLLTRHPFPGPGLVVRIEGEVTAERLRIARQLDEIYIAELRRHRLYDGIWQAGVTLTASQTTCTKGDDADSGSVAAYWAVWSVNGFTAQPANLPFDFQLMVSRRFTNEIREIGAAVYRTSGKPPSTIEWG